MAILNLTDLHHVGRPPFFLSFWLRPFTLYLVLGFIDGIAVLPFCRYAVWQY